jgi:hypothetical protein
MELLVGTAETGPAISGWGERLNGLRQVLGGARYLELVTDALR